jgi:hypothetical protein
VHVTRFGRPAPGVAVQPLRIGPSNPDRPPQTGTPPDRFTPLPPDPTDPNGQTTIEVRCTHPGTPRQYLDGQIYQLLLAIRGVDQLPLTPEIRSQRDPITALVFDAYRIPDSPTWFDDVQPILAQYANLYPIMSQRLVRLDRYEDVVAHRAILQFSFALDISDPNSMPVTRDLSAAKRRMILEWLERADLPRGEPHRRLMSTVEAEIPPSADDSLDPTDSKGQFFREHLRSAGSVEGIDS